MRMVQAFSHEEPIDSKNHGKDRAYLTVVSPSSDWITSLA